jgi:hypothetical protein
MSATELAQWVSPAFIVLGGLVTVALAAKHWFERYMAGHRALLAAENAKLNMALLARLDTQDKVQAKTLEQTTKTNGRVDGLEQQQKAFEREHSVFRERLSHVEGQAEVLLREKGQPI